jgi:guanylate kinase
MKTNPPLTPGTLTPGPSPKGRGEKSFRERLVIVSGPSGAGKTTVMQGVFRRTPVPLAASVSATTRPPRSGEVDGKDYYFLTNDDFQSRRQRGDFLECFQVFDKGHWYGTLWTEVAAGFKAGKWVVLEIDVQGALAVMGRFADAISIFIQPGSLEELERRLRARATETEEAVQRRLARAREELAFASGYRYNVINDRIENAVNEICNILTKEWENVQDD